MSFNRFLSVLLVAVLIICFCQLTNCSPFSIAQAGTYGSVDIGRNITRTDDLQKGVSCYTINDRAISCVKTM